MNNFYPGHIEHIGTFFYPVYIFYLHLTQLQTLNFQFSQLEYQLKCGEESPKVSD